jgi:2-haloacid dehalogenase
MAERWATFDCYGTLIDWNGGVGDALERLFPDEERASLLAGYHRAEPELQSAGFRTYREIMRLAVERLASERGRPLGPFEADALGESLPRWRPFPEVPAALAEARSRAWRLAILSNTDRDLIRASIEQIGVPFDAVVVSEDVRSYKPALGHWRAFSEEIRPPAGRHVHVGASLFHDIGPARELALPSVWINRLGERPEPQPTRELPDLARLPDTLDELVPP